MDEGVFPDEHLPTGSVVDGSTLTSDINDSFDFVVIGSGAAGAVAAHTLAKAGFFVAVMEEGPWIRTRDFGKDVLPAFQKMFRDSGVQAIEGHSFIPLIQGRCVGGSTLMNSAIAWRTPEDVLADWNERFGLTDLTMRALEPHFLSLEEELNASPVSTEALGTQNRFFLNQLEKQGMEPRRMHRYEKGCQGTGRCLTGCPSAAKQSMNVSYVPWLLKLGGKIFVSCRAARIEIKNGKAVSVIGSPQANSNSTLRVRLRAKYGVLVAASTIQTPNILRRSGLHSKALGRHFQVHPGVGMGGLFDRPIQMNIGATQGAESVALRKSDRLKFEAISMQPELATIRTPGVGQELMSRLELYSSLTLWAGLVRAESEGSIDIGWGGRDRIRMSLIESDMMRLRKACVLMATWLFDGGAKEVWSGLYGDYSVLKSYDDVRKLENAPLDSRAYSLVATHLFGAARMGVDPKTSVVGPDFSTHEVKQLYVLDSSVFPTNLGVNPQHSIMALSRFAVTRLANSVESIAPRSRRI